ncbi:hypothetical protein GCM10009817_36620 [Terrabacter lapilli]|uniref:Membrane protein ArfC n=1 Tax=Terrabacter lapilli TaxID=436231 RepID=A0ABN2SRC5_9MICO
MSEAGKAVLWIVVAIAVIAVIIWLFVSAGRRRAAEARRFEASEQRGRAATRRADLRSPGRGHDVVPASPASSASPAPAEQPAPAVPAAPAAPALGAAAVGAAAFTQEDDDEDLADAANPFAATAATAVGTRSAEEHPEERSTIVSDKPAPQTAETTSSGGTGSTVFDPESVSEGQSTEATDSVPTAEASGADGSAATDGQSVTPPAATIDEPQEVDVPALADRDEFIAEGGTPAGDPGDHRGQPWATTPGQHDPGDSDAPADEGLDVDMAPHSHASDEVDETAEAVDPAGDAPRREEAEPAPDAAAAAFPEEHDPTTDEHDTAGDGATAGRSDTGERQEARTRRTSSFDEVVDGGFGLGSAAPIGDGAQPLGHAVKAQRDGRTFLAPGDAGYDELEPDVWFYNEDAARRAGFDRQGE